VFNNYLFIFVAHVSNKDKSLLNSSDKDNIANKSLGKQWPQDFFCSLLTLVCETPILGSANQTCCNSFHFM
jgi:hypothetical protein